MVAFVMHKSIFISFLFLLGISGICSAQGLEIKESFSGLKYISYGNKIAFGYGASPQQILTYLPDGNGNNYEDWINWATRYKINHVRSYPPSFIVQEPAINVFQYADESKKRFDLKKFNPAYFEELGKACRLMKDNGMFIHLQFWQSVTWKKQWRLNYYNPDNNINPDISLDAGPGAFMSLKNPVLLKHQKQYVYRLLNSTAKLGNVFFDIANEIGNGTDSSKDWVLEILKTIRQWEAENNTKVMVTINDEGGLRIKGIEEIFNAVDVIVKDLGRWDEHTRAQAVYGKPTVSVRNIDFDFENKKRQYFYGKYNLELNKDELLQIRGRKYWWRMFMARVQMAGGYADSYDEYLTFPGATFLSKVFGKLGIDQLVPQKMRDSYSLNTLTEDNYLLFRNFIDKIRGYQDLRAFDNIVLGHPASHAYCLQSTDEIVLYLESPNGKAGYSYPRTDVSLNNLTVMDGIYQGYFYQPDDGKQVDIEVSVKDSQAALSIPEFSDDLAVYLYISDKSGSGL
jgi:hypothetical protein